MITSRLAGLTFVFDVDKVPADFVDRMMAVPYVKEVEGPLVNGAIAVTVDYQQAVKWVGDIERLGDFEATMGLRIDKIQRSLARRAVAK